MRHARLVACIMLASVVGVMVSGCTGRDDSRGGRSDGDVALIAEGKDAILDNGCGSCHGISGIESADGAVGPPLRDMSRQVYIAGVLANTPDNLERWLLDPASVDERTAMPDVGLTRREAKAIRAWLYAQEGD